MRKLREAFLTDVVSVRLVKEAPLMSVEPLRTPEDVIKLLGDKLSELDRECMTVINLRSDGSVINCSLVSMGGVNNSYAGAREVFKVALLSNAANIILVHNHVSGTLAPSVADIAVTDRMIKLGELMEIPVLDHVIVGGNNHDYFSFRECGMVNCPSIELEKDIKKLSFAYKEICV